MQGNTWLFIKVTLEGVVFAFLFSRQGFRQQQQEVLGDLAGLALCSQASYEGGQLSLLLHAHRLRWTPSHCLPSTHPAAITIGHTLPGHTVLPCMQWHLILHALTAWAGRAVAFKPA